MFLWIKSTLFFSLFSSDDKKDQHIFFHFCFRQFKESSHFVPAYFFQTPSKFQASLYRAQTRLCFLRTFHSISCFFYPQNVCLVVPWRDIIMRQNTVHLENRKACKNVESRFASLPIFTKAKGLLCFIKKTLTTQRENTLRLMRWFTGQT